MGLEENDGAFLVGMVTRLSSQKGIDLIEQVAGDLFSMEGAQFVILGTGEQRYENMLRYYAHKYPGKVSAQIKFDNWLSHKIYAASDAFFMPSAFEPCGLAQMIAMRYGTLPIVRETGGLKDTVVPYNKFTKEGTGFSFRDFNAYDMLFVLKYAQEVFANKTEWNAHLPPGDEPGFFLDGIGTKIFGALRKAFG